MTRAPLAGADLHDWVTLRRVSEGFVGKVGGGWFDRGRRVPCYVAEALPGLCAAGLVRLAEPDPTTMARAALTDAGADRFAQLCQQRDQAMQARAAHLDAVRRGQAAAKQLGILLAVCRVLALGSGHTGAQPTGRACPTCQAPPAAPAPTPQCPHSPEAGQLPDEQPARQVPASGGRPDTTVAVPPDSPADHVDQEKAQS